MKILIIGAFGWTARAIIQRLQQAGHEIIAFDLPTALCPKHVEASLSSIVRGDVAKLEEVKRATEAADAIIHLAVAIGKNDYASPEIPFAVNVKGTYNVFEAARQLRVSKVIVISSAAVHLKQTRGHLISALSPLQCSQGGDHLYDLSKRLQEEIAKAYCETHQMNAFILRAGHIVDGRAQTDPHGKALTTLDYCRGGWLCRYDLAQACAKALTLNTTGYHAYHIIGSIQARHHFDIERTEKELGLIFESRFEEYEERA